MKLCEHCGKKIDDAAIFCKHCGAKLNGADSVPAPIISDTSSMEYATQYADLQPSDPGVQPGGQQQFGQPSDMGQQPFGQPAPAPAGGAVKGGLSKGKIAIIAAGAVVIAAAAVGASHLIAVSNCSKPFKQLEEGFEKSDFKKILSAFPSKYSDEIENAVGKSDFKDMVDDADDGLDDFKDAIDENTEFGSKIKISHKILSADKLSKDQIDNIEKYNKDAGLKIDIKSAYNTDVRFTIKGSGGAVGYCTYNFTVGKVGKDWVIVDINSVLSDYSEYDDVDTILGFVTKAVYNALNDDYDHYDDYDDYDFDDLYW